VLPCPPSRATTHLSMTIAAPPPITTTEANVPAPQPQPQPEPQGWRELRGDDAIQFEEVTIAVPDPPEPGLLDEALEAILRFLADLFGPVGQFIGINWSVLQWILVALAGTFLLYVLARTLGPLALRRKGASAAASEPDWQPSREQTLALLEDADRLAAEGRYDEATRLLLQRSVSHIADARPDWVDPSSTARELASLPSLSEPARRAFAVISERVERSLFALRRLEEADWTAARSAYADFAGAAIERREGLAV